MYAAIIDDPGIRRVFTERLLADPRLMLRSPWGHSWNLAHPGLAGQLAPVLEALADPAAPQPGRDQSYVALTLAREAGIAGLMPSLLKIAARADRTPGCARRPCAPPRSSTRPPPRPSSPGCSPR